MPCLSAKFQENQPNSFQQLLHKDEVCEILSQCKQKSPWPNYVRKKSIIMNIINEVMTVGSQWERGEGEYDWLKNGSLLFSIA